MTALHGSFAVVSAIVLFLYGLQGFSRELQAVGGDALRTWLGRVTANRWKGFLIGAFATAIVQSSSAVTALSVALVDAGVISFRSSLGILLGANVGTTTTAWLVSFKLTGIGPIFIVIGALISAIPVRQRIIGKAVFYFGLIFFALDLISAELKPLQNEPLFRKWMSHAQTPWKGVLAGLFLTAIIQSSSVTTGFAILLVQQQILPAEAAIFVVVGANVGSTSTALTASLGMNSVARATAISNFGFNFIGMMLVFPLLDNLAQILLSLIGDPSMAVATAHIAFNLSIALLFLSTLDWIAPRLHKLLIRPADERTSTS